jgi:hypothetical protein
MMGDRVWQVVRYAHRPKAAGRFSGMRPNDGKVPVSVAGKGILCLRRNGNRWTNGSFWALSPPSFWAL